MFIFPMRYDAFSRCFYNNTNSSAYTTMFLQEITPHFDIELDNLVGIEFHVYDRNELPVSDSYRAQHEIHTYRLMYRGIYVFLEQDSQIILRFHMHQILHHLPNDLLAGASVTHSIYLRLVSVHEWE